MNRTALTRLAAPGPVASLSPPAQVHPREERRPIPSGNSNQTINLLMETDMIRTRVITSRQARFFAVALTALCALPAGTSAALASNTPTTAPGAAQEAVTRTHIRNTTAAHAVSPLFTCPDRSICIYPNDDFTGNYPGGQPVILDPAGTTSGVWFSLDSIGASSPHPGSVNNNSGSSIWVYDHQAPVVPGSNPWCLSPGKYVLDHAYGHFELFYSDSTCAHNYTRPLP